MDTSLRPAPPTASEVQFFCLAEAGILAAQALLLCESIRAFGGAYAACPITAVSPRVERRPSRETVRKLAQMDAEYIDLDFQSPSPSYGPSFRIYAAAHIESISGPPTLVQLDSDTLFVAPPELSLENKEAWARPVDGKGMCTTGESDAFDPFWRELSRICCVDYEKIPHVETTIGRTRVRASYNGGFIAVRRTEGLFSLTLEFFERLVRAGMRPWAGTGIRVNSGIGLVDVEGSEYWGTSQAAFSLAAVAKGTEVRVLPRSHNIPLHLFDLIEPFELPPVHFHYHGMFTAGEQSANPLFDGRVSLPDDTVAWLRERLPLSAG